MENCIFCKIVSGQIPSYKVYEDDKYLAFLDIRPLSPGHTLIIPKHHVRWVWDMEDIGAYYQVIQKIANAQKKALETDYVVSLVFGEEVPHAHVWLVPRFANDGHGGAIKLENIKEIDKEQMAALAERIKSNL